MPGGSLTPELRRELEAIAAGRGCELIHVESQAGLLRLILDKPDGVRLDDCEAVSKEASVALDLASYGRSRYTLEVSSPGLDRKLYGPADYERFVGRRVRVRHVDRSTGRKATVVGKLTSFRANGEAELLLTETEDDLDVAIRLADIEVARLTIEL
jgi:ribosome maturation factor RimP